MSANSKIEWTDASWNPVRARHTENLADGTIKAHTGWHCEHVSQACVNCYAEAINKRLGTKLPYKPGHRKDVEISLDEKALLLPLTWKKPRKIFVCSMTDLFADFVTNEFIDRMFAVMALCPQHTFQVLTKRPERMRGYMSMARAHPVAIEAMDITIQEHYKNSKSDTGKESILQGDIVHLKIWPLPNVWLGVTAEDQDEANNRIPWLLDTPASVRFVSCEPLLGPVDITPYLGIDWVICGGESDRTARPMHPAWVRGLRDQCAKANVAFFFKQWGKWAPSGTDTKYQPGKIISGKNTLNRVFRNNNGLEYGGCFELAIKNYTSRLLDGIEHSNFPKVQ